MYTFILVKLCFPLIWMNYSPHKMHDLSKILRHRKECLLSLTILWFECFRCCYYLVFRKSNASVVHVVITFKVIFHEQADLFQILNMTCYWLSLMLMTGCLKITNRYRIQTNKYYEKNKTTEVIDINEITIFYALCIWWPQCCK